MAISLLSAALSTPWVAQRTPSWQANTQWYTALVSDLAVNDYLVGPRARVVATGATTAGLRALTLDRMGVQWTVNWTATSSVVIARGS